MTAPRPVNRSLGLKLLIVCALALTMSLPAFAIFGLIYDRTSRAQQVIAEVGERYGGEQSFIGPIVVAPYRVTRTAPNPAGGAAVQSVEDGWYVVFPETGEADANADTDIRSRGDLFKVRTYTADVRFRAHFDLTGEPSAAPEGAIINWERALILVGVADPRGTQGRAELTIEGRDPIPFEPGTVFSGFAGSPTAPVVTPQGRPIGQMQWLAADASGIARPGAEFDASTALRFTGVESMGVAAFARNTDIRLRGDWGSVGYAGAFPRADSEEDEEGAAERNAFDARWSVPYVARGVAASGAADTLGMLANADARVRFIDPANPYQSVTRALKYALLFIGVVFLAYFMFEATSERRVHPAQYVMVGLAQIIFYLLLLAIAERIGFDWAFLIAAGATVMLISAYLGAIFKSRTRGLIALGGFSVLYALIYLLMRIEDYALLVGAVAAFLTIAAVMWFTRNLDWYEFAERAKEPQTPPQP
ncbi:MAG: cell envelope integrity protein CreD [Hyphomonadaceae bacterium]